MKMRGGEDSNHEYVYKKCSKEQLPTIMDVLKRRWWELVNITNSPGISHTVIAVMEILRRRLLRIVRIFTNEALQRSSYRNNCKCKLKPDKTNNLGTGACTTSSNQLPRKGDVQVVIYVLSKMGFCFSMLELHMTLDGCCASLRSFCKVFLLPEKTIHFPGESFWQSDGYPIFLPKCWPWISTDTHVVTS